MNTGSLDFLLLISQCYKASEGPAALRRGKEERIMKAYLVMLLVVVAAPVLVILDPADVASVCSQIAKGFFLVVPIILMVGSAVGLISRHRA